MSILITNLVPLCLLSLLWLVIGKLSIDFVTIFAWYYLSIFISKLFLIVLNYQSVSALRWQLTSLRKLLVNLLETVRECLGPILDFSARCFFFLKKLLRWGEFNRRAVALYFHPALCRTWSIAPHLHLGKWYPWYGNLRGSFIGV